MFFEKATSGVMQIAQYLMTIFAVVVAYAILGQMPLMAVLLSKISSNEDLGMEELGAFQSKMDFAVFGISQNFGFLLMLMIFMISMAALLLCVKYLHKLPIKNLITPMSKINWGKILFGFGFWLLIAIAMEGVMYFLNPDIYTMNFQPSKWVILFLICLTLLPIQTSFEELFFRGYLMPGIALLAKNKWLPLIISSVLFGLVHGMNPEVEKYGFWTMQFYYISAGLFLGLVAILDDSLELALGIHAATNFFGASLLSFEGSVLQTDTIWKATEINPAHMIVVFYVAAVIFLLVCNRKYGWRGLQRLTEPVFVDKSTNFDITDHLQE